MMTDEEFHALMQRIAQELTGRRREYADHVLADYDATGVWVDED